MKENRIIKRSVNIIKALCTAFAVILLLLWAGIEINHTFFGYPYRNTAVQASPRDKAATVFSAAQTYVVDYYKENDGAILQSVTCADLYNSGLLTRMPDTNNVNIVIEKDIPQVKYVEYDSVRYPD
ncbi:MAG: hypothetical protein J6A07_05255 [Firmicutes bacterium]|nr:hypothetical protein [Bacillota bacterium]